MVKANRSKFYLKNKKKCSQNKNRMLNKTSSKYDAPSLRTLTLSMTISHNISTQQKNFLIHNFLWYFSIKIVLAFCFFCKPPSLTVAQVLSMSYEGKFLHTLSSRELRYLNCCSYLTSATISSEREVRC